MNLRMAVKIRNDITDIEKCWQKYISQMHSLKEIKIEEVDDESVNFETVEMIIEPVEPINRMYFPSWHDEDVDYLDMDSKHDSEKKCESYDYDDGSIDNNYESIGSDDNQENMVRDTKVWAINSCQHCNETDLTRAELKLHQQTFHPNNSNAEQFVCDICRARYSSRYGIRTHMKRHMQGSTEGANLKSIKRYQCSRCDERFSKKVLLVEHELRHSGVSLYAT